MIIDNTATTRSEQLLSDMGANIAWELATLPLGHRDNLYTVSNQLLNNKIYTKNKLQFNYYSCNLVIIFVI